MVTRRRSRPGPESEAAEDHLAADRKSISTVSAMSDTVLTQPASDDTYPSIELILKLARLVTDESHLATIIDAANKVTGRCGLESAVGSGKAFFVRVRPEILAVDFDDDDAVAAANRLYWRCRMLGIPALLIASGQEGRRHVFCWPKDDSQRTQLAIAAKDDGGDVRIAIRPPLSPHRWHAEGVTPKILHGLDIVLDFARTGAMPDKPWGSAIIEAVVKGDRTRSRSERINSAVMAAVNAGWSATQMDELLAATGLAIFKDYAGRSKDRGAIATEKWLTGHVWASAEKRVREFPAKRQEPASELGALSARVEQLVWTGLSGASERALYIALIGKATEVGSLEFKSSHRDLMQRSGLCANKTVQAALKRLRTRELIERNLDEVGKRSRVSDQPLRFGLTSNWRLLTTHLSEESLARRTTVPVADCVSIRHDAFLNGSGLGKYAHRIWVALNAAPGSTAARLSSGLAIGRRTVNKHLQALHQRGLADHDADGRWFPVSRSLDSVAADLGNLGRLQRLGFEQARQRANFDNYIQRRWRS
jgi:hypothetical protein